MADRLKDKAAVITGAGTGIGEAVAHKFAYEGAKVVLMGLPGDPVDDVVNTIHEYGHVAYGFSGDAAEEEDAKNCINFAVEKLGKIDILVNDAGYYAGNIEIQDFPLELFDRMMIANVRSAFLMSKYAVPHLHKTRGNIVNFGSEAGYNGSPYFTPYGATKAAIHGLTMGIAGEQAKYAVRCNAICPGAVDTAWTHVETGPWDEKTEKQLIGATPFGRRATPEEIANVVAFLASDEASYVTGSLWLADGGLTPAHGIPGQESKFTDEPKGVLKHLKHSLDGLKNQPRYPKAEGKSLK